VTYCSQCGTQLPASGASFCTTCGTSTISTRPEQHQFVPPPPPLYAQPAYSGRPLNMTQPPPQQQSLSATNPHHLAARGVAQMFGLHPAMALLTVIVNTMIFGAAGVVGVISGGLGLIPLTFVSTFCGIILGIITYKAQKKWYDDDHDSALIKASIVALLTAIPAGLPGYLVIPSGIIGFFRRSG
jgi:zinc-ribbon domain